MEIALLKPQVVKIVTTKNVLGRIRLEAAKYANILVGKLGKIFIRNLSGMCVVYSRKQI